MAENIVVDGKMKVELVEAGMPTKRISEVVQSDSGIKQALISALSDFSQNVGGRINSIEQILANPNLSQKEIGKQQGDLKGLQELQQKVEGVTSTLTQSADSAEKLISAIVECGEDLLSIVDSIKYEFNGQPGVIGRVSNAYANDKRSVSAKSNKVDYLAKLRESGLTDAQIAKLNNEIDKKLQERLTVKNNQQAGQEREQRQMAQYIDQRMDYLKKQASKAGVSEREFNANAETYRKNEEILYLAKREKGHGRKQLQRVNNNGRPREAYGYVPGSKVNGSQGALALKYFDSFFNAQGEYIAGVDNDGKPRYSVIVNDPRLENKENLGEVGDLRNASLTKLENAYDSLDKVKASNEQQLVGAGEAKAAQVKEDIEKITTLQDKIFSAIVDAYSNTQESFIREKLEAAYTGAKVDYNAGVTEVGSSPFRDGTLAQRIRQKFQLTATETRASEILAPHDVGAEPERAKDPRTSEQELNKELTSQARAIAKEREDRAVHFQQLLEALNETGEQSIQDSLNKAKTEGKDLEQAFIDYASSYLNEIFGIDVDKIIGQLKGAVSLNAPVRQYDAGGAYEDNKGNTVESISRLWDGDLAPFAIPEEILESMDTDAYSVLQKAITNNIIDNGDLEDIEKAKNIMLKFAELARNFGLDIVADKFEKASAAGGPSKTMDSTILANTLTKIVSFPETLDASFQATLDILNQSRQANGLKKIDLDQYKADIFASNPELEEKYNVSKMASDAYNAGYGEGGTEEAVSRFFSSVDEYERKTADTTASIISWLAETFDNIKDVKSTKIKKDGDEGPEYAVTKPEKDWIYDIIDYRLDKSGTLFNPNAGIGAHYYQRERLTGLPSDEYSGETSPALQTSLFFQGGLLGSVFGGSGLKENLEIAKQQKTLLEEELSSQGGLGDNHLLAQIDFLGVIIDKLESALQPVNETTQAQEIQFPEDNRKRTEEDRAEIERVDDRKPALGRGLLKMDSVEKEYQKQLESEKEMYVDAQKELETEANSVQVGQQNSISGSLPEQSALEKVNTVLDAHNEKLSKAIELEKEKAKISGTLSAALNREESSFSDSTKATVAHNNAVEEAANVTIKYKKVASYDNDTHTYLDEQGNKFYTATQISAAYQGKNGEVFARDSAAVREALNRLPDGQQLTAEDVGMNERDFSFYRGVVSKGIYGDMVHETRDLLDKAGVNKVQDLRGHQVEVKWEGQTKLMDAEEAYLNMIESKVPMLEKLGRSDSVESLSRDITAIYDMLDKAHLVSTGFSEQQLGLTIGNGKSSFNIAVTPDQLMFNSQTGAFALTDSKTGSVSGMEGIQLAIQKAAILANKDNPELRQMYKDAGLEEIEDFDSYIVKIKDGYSELIKYLDISDEKLFQIVERAVGVLNGTAQPLSKEELKREKGALSAGRVMGYAIGAGKDVQNLINQYTSSYAQKAKIQQEITQMELQGQNYTGTKRIENQNYIAMLKRQQASINIPELTVTKDESGEEVYYLDKKRISQEQYNKLKEEQQKIDNKLLSTSQRQTDEIVNKQSFFQKLVANFKNSFDQIQSYIMGIFSAQTVQRIVQSFLQETQQLDSAMVDLQIASGETRTSIKSMMTDFNKMAISMGKSTTEIAQAANDWLRAGYTGKEAAELTNASMSLATLGQINSAEATSNLISVLKGWKLSTEDVIGVVDKLVTVDLSAAVSAGEIAKAMSRGNNIAQSAGTSLDRYIGYITTIADLQKSKSIL